MSLVELGNWIGIIDVPSPRSFLLFIFLISYIAIHFYVPFHQMYLSSFIQRQPRNITFVCHF
jgi:hypothetical protein